MADPKIIDPVPRIQLRGQPARLLTAAGPSLEWSRRILEFRKNLRIKALDAWIDKQEASLTRPEAIRAMMETVLHILSKDPGEKPKKKGKGK